MGMEESELPSREEVRTTRRDRRRLTPMVVDNSGIRTIARIADERLRSGGGAEVPSQPPTGTSR